jgi:hypothetical protein
MFFAIVASRLCKKFASIAPNELIICAFSDDGHSLGPRAFLVAIGTAMPAEYTRVGLTVIIRKNGLFSLLGVGNALNNLPNDHIMRGEYASAEGTKVLGGGAVSTPDFVRDVYETVLS